MKKIIFTLCVVLCVVMQSCDKEEIFYKNNGVFVLLKPSSAKNGDNVMMCIDDYVHAMGYDSSRPLTEDGDILVKKIIYYVDGEVVVESTDANSGFSATYKVANLSVGGHKVTAEFVPAKKSYHIDVTIKSATLTVEE